MTPSELQNLGLSPKEAEIFLYILESDSSGITIQRISRAFSLPVKNVNSYTQNLVRKNFLKSVKKEGSRIRYFAQQPHEIQEMIVSKMKELQYQLQIMENLKTLYYGKRLLKIELVEGEEAFEILRKKILKQEGIIFDIENADERWNGNEEREKFERNNYLIHVEATKNIKNNKKTSNKAYYYLPSDTFNIHGSMTIAGDMVVISQPGDIHTGAVINHQQTANNIKELFKLALPEIKRLGSIRETDENNDVITST